MIKGLNMDNVIDIYTDSEYVHKLGVHVLVNFTAEEISDFCDELKMSSGEGEGALVFCVYLELGESTDWPEDEYQAFLDNYFDPQFISDHMLDRCVHLLDDQGYVDTESMDDEQLSVLYHDLIIPEIDYLLESLFFEDNLARWGNTLGAFLGTKWNGSNSYNVILRVARWDIEAE